MNLRQLLLDLVPPELNLDKVDRQRLRRDIYRVPMTRQERRRNTWAALGFVATGFGGLMAIVIAKHALKHNWPLLFAPLLFVGWWIALAWIVSFNNNRRVCVALRELGYDVCTVCGYWFRGLGVDVKNCPECGAERNPMRK